MTTAINKSYITQIIRTPNTYIIHVADYAVDGNCLLGSGGINTTHTKITVCKINDPEEYRTVSRHWNEL